ncbi:hypothetical protein JMJ55_16995 [Belnapia sp. T6]|uniref:Lipoprotein n=1 Tax=Belnapia mucosa TaxID=2804532 RepID=A0ABS1V5R7_9PROT|nr:hypothetical protein [Belnapia mucosa]MBL6457035.1 hypothetical protein [Belnapia mucosa]
MVLRRSLVIAPVMALALMGCQRAVPIVEGGGTFAGQASLAQRGAEIRRAGAGLGWIMQDQGPGLMRGTLNLRSHQAVVDIPYDTRRFTIRYVTSSNLDYGGGTIHRNYNSWVRNLQNAILVQSGADAPRS